MSRDVCIKRNSYCPICKGVVMADCWHDSSQFSGGEVVRLAQYHDELNAAREHVRHLLVLAHRAGIVNTETKVADKWLQEQDK